MGIDEEKIDEIIALHTETVEGLKADIARYKEDAEKLPQAREDLKKAQDALEEATKDEWHEKYDSLKTEYDTFKEAQAAKETHGAKETAYRKLLGGGSEPAGESVRSPQELCNRRRRSKGLFLPFSDWSDKKMHIGRSVFPGYYVRDRTPPMQIVSALLSEPM